MTRKVTITNSGTEFGEHVEVLVVDQNDQSRITVLELGDELECGPWADGEMVTVVIKTTEEGR